MKAQPRFKNMRRWGLLVVGSLLGLLNPSQSETVEGASLGGPSHIGTFEGSTTFTTGSSNGINPGLYLEVMDKYGNYTEYTSEDGIITIPNTQEGAYVTQAKLLGKTKYRDQDTGELLDQWEDGRNLTLESVQMPVLSTTGKNLFNESDFTCSNNTAYWGDKGEATYAPNRIAFNEYIPVKPNTTYVLSGDYTSTQYSAFNYVLYDENKNFIKKGGGYSTSNKFTTPYNAKFLRFGFESFNLGRFQLEKGSVATSYEPYKSNILSTSEDVTLRGIGEVRDTLDLLTGEVTERIGEIVLDETLDYRGSSSANGENTMYFQFDLGAYPSSTPISHYFKVSSANLYVSDNDYEAIRITGSGALQLRILKSKLPTTDTDGVKEFFKQNNISIQYQLAQESIKTVGLNSTYYFQPVTNREVYISGTILPLVCSVTIPTEPLTFVLNPNAEADQQFIAPEFTITNHTPTSIYLEVSRFEQLTQVLTDVLPEAHDDWSQLDRAQSKEIALGLVPKPSEGWLSLEEGPRYVAADSNYYLGEVKANSSVDFTFTAHHGRAFVEALNPQYRLSFIFDFFDR